MTKRRRISAAVRFAGFIYLAVLLFSEAAIEAAGPPSETLSFGPLGAVAIYRQSEHPRHVALFVSGDGGWTRGVVNMAKALSSLDALVVGIDIVRYRKALAAQSADCSYCAADFEALSQYVQKKLGLPGYVPPVLVGYSSGATLVYATLVQAPTGTFRGAISMGFCPDLPLPKPLCRGNGLAWKVLPRDKGYYFLPASALETPWIAFQGTIDQVCDAAVTERYAKQVGSGRLVLLPKVGHGFAVERNWMPQFKQAFSDLTRTKQQTAWPKGPQDLSDLPLVEVPAAKPGAKNMAVLISGDGGWAGIDRQVAGFLAGHGVNVVGLNSLEYLWHRRTPEEAGKDLDRIIKYYVAEWGANKVILVGYSLGADILPFMADRLPPDTTDLVKLIALLGPGERVDFEFHVSEWLTGVAPKDSLRVMPEVEKLRGLKILCFYGDREKDSLCPLLPPGLAEVVATKHGHHFGGEYKPIAERILEETP